MAPARIVVARLDAKRIGRVDDNREIRWAQTVRSGGRSKKDSNEEDEFQCLLSPAEAHEDGRHVGRRTLGKGRHMAQELAFEPLDAGLVAAGFDYPCLKGAIGFDCNHTFE